MALRRLRITLLLIVAGTLVIGALSWLIPRPAGAEEAEFYSPIGTSVTFVDALLTAGSSILFLAAVRGFKTELRTAYRFVAFAALCMGLLTLVDPYIEYRGLWENYYFNTASYFAYFFGAILMYLGMRKFTRQLAFKTRAASLLTVTGVTAALTVAYNFLPHIDNWADVPSEIIYDVLQVLVIVPAVWFAAAAFMAVRIRNRTGDEYHRPFGWLAIALCAHTFTSFTIVLLQLTGYDNWYFNTRAYEVPYIISEVCLLASGYFFCAVTIVMARRRPRTPATSMDIIHYVASKVSDMDKIEPYLDEVRLVTSHVKPGEPLSPEDQKRLAAVYLALENYLVNDDRLRAYTSEGLRREVVREMYLHEQPGSTFWPFLRQ